MTHPDIAHARVLIAGKFMCTVISTTKLFHKFPTTWSVLNFRPMVRYQYGRGKVWPSPKVVHRPDFTLRHFHLEYQTWPRLTDDVSANHSLRWRLIRPLKVGFSVSHWPETGKESVRNTKSTNWWPQHPQITTVAASWSFSTLLCINARPRGHLYYCGKPD